MACVTLAKEYDADLTNPAVSTPLRPCRRLDLETTAASARDTPSGEGGPRHEAAENQERRVAGTST